MTYKDKHEILLDLYRTEIIESAKLRDNLYDQNNKLLLENSDLTEELSELNYENQRLKKHVGDLKKHIADLKKIKMGDATDEILKSCNVPAILRNKKITAENSD